MNLPVPSTAPVDVRWQPDLPVRSAPMGHGHRAADTVPGKAGRQSADRNQQAPREVRTTTGGPTRGVTNHGI